MKNFYIDQYGNAAPKDAQYYDTFWKQFLKAENDTLYVFEYSRWSVSQHKNGVNMLNNEECVRLGGAEQ